MIDTSVIGIRDVRSILEQARTLPAKYQTQASKSGAKIALNYAKSKVYTGGFKQRTGDLKRSLRAKLEKRRVGKRVYTIGSRRFKSKGAEKNPYYSHWVDYGFTTRNGRYIRGNRFLRDAVDINRNEINQTILRELYNALRSIR